MLQLINHIKTNYKLRSESIRQFGPKFNVDFQVGSYQVKTAVNSKELLSCFKLRNEVFNIEFRDLKGLNYDFDEFDSVCDHIMIIYKATQEVVGTYRLNSCWFTNNFYSEQEFHMKNLFNLKGPFLELGRACINKDHRKGSVIALLWKGIADYMNLSRAQILFGCSSVKVTESRESAIIFQYLKQNDHVQLGFEAKPKSSYEISHFSQWCEYFEKNYNADFAEEAERLIPSLLKSYLKLGAKVISEPALDEDFNCIDFLTVLDRNGINKTAERKFGVKPSNFNPSPFPSL